MKTIKLSTLMFGLLLLGCNQTDTKTTSETVDIGTKSIDDKKKIEDLIRQVLIWADSENSIDLLPILTYGKDSIYTGFDLVTHKQNLDKLRRTNFFADEFIDNYDQIILTLDKGLKNGKYGQWFTGEIAPFSFTNDSNPWCLCQDVPYDEPNPWNLIEVSIIKIDKNKGKAKWSWGEPESNAGPDWIDFSYKFRVVKVNDQWKIAYLKGFDLKESSR